MLQLQDPNNFGCMLRDAIYKNLRAISDSPNGSIKMSVIKQKLESVVIPEEYWGDILRMADYRKLDRTTDMIEQMLQGIVFKGIIQNLLKEGI